MEGHHRPQIPSSKPLFVAPQLWAAIQTLQYLHPLLPPISTLSQTFVPTLATILKENKLLATSQRGREASESNLELGTNWKLHFEIRPGKLELGELRVWAREESLLRPNTKVHNKKTRRTKYIRYYSLHLFSPIFWSVGGVNKSSAGNLSHKLLRKIFCNPGWKNTMFTCLASARLKNVTRWVRRGADDCSSNFLYSSDLTLTAKRI